MATLTATATVRHLDQDVPAYVFTLDTPTAVRYHLNTPDGITGHADTVDQVTVMVSKHDTETTYTALHPTNGQRLEFQRPDGRMDGYTRQFRKPVTDLQDAARAGKVLDKWLNA